MNQSHFESQLASLLRSPLSGSSSGINGGSAQPLVAVITGSPGASNSNATDGSAGVNQGLTDLLAGITSLREATLQQAASLEQNTGSLVDNTASRIRDVVSNVSSAVAGGSGILGGGIIGAIPLIGSLVKLFTGGGGNSTPETALPKFSLSSSIQAEAALPGLNGGLTGVSYAGDGSLRRDVTSRPAQAAPQITVQVQAMDSQSFMDRSDDIARAVRQAMLNMHPVNDVMGDL